MGDVVDWYHFDEEPEDHEIYPQIATRMINGDRGRGGRGILTFTPENGKTELVSQFMDEDLPSQAMLTATWDDAEHMTEEKKVISLAKYPPYQHAMRSRGVPLMGAGLIYEIDENLIKHERFEIPAHFKLINGMDFGWDHPWAMVQLAIDEENEVIYVIHAFKRSKLAPHDAWRAVKKWCAGVPVAWPQDGLQTRENGKEKRDMYVIEDFELTDSYATWEGGGVSVNVGITQLNRLFQTGQLRIFDDLFEVFDELRQYHTKINRNENAEIVKLKDDLLDAIRYAYMMRREAIYKYELDAESEEYEESYDDRSHNAMGY
jgi:phage terminase large subunit-like protein